MTKKKTILPRKMSALIRVALADLRLVERSKRYVVNMDAWHLAKDDDHPCAVCFGGSVMAKSLDADPGRILEPRDFPGNTDQLFALNCLRTGDLVNAAAHLKIDLPALLDVSNVTITPYDTSPTLFRHDMRYLAKNLAAVGL